MNRAAGENKKSEWREWWGLQKFLLFAFFVNVGGILLLIGIAAVWRAEILLKLLPFVFGLFALAAAWQAFSRSATPVSVGRVIRGRAARLFGVAYIGIYLFVCFAAWTIIFK